MLTAQTKPGNAVANWPQRIEGTRANAALFVYDGSSLVSSASGFAYTCRFTGCDLAALSTCARRAGGAR